MMASITKFQFETEFDALPAAPPPAEVVDVPEPPPQFSEDDLAAAATEAFEKGRAAGRGEAEAAIEKRTADALGALAAALDGIGPGHDRAMEETRSGALTLAAAVARKLVPVLLRQNAGAAVESLVSEILPRLVDEPRLVIRVNDALIETLKDRIDQITASCGYRGHVILLGDDRLADADCRIEWADGGAEYDTDRLMREVDALVERFLHGVGEKAPSVPVPSVNESEEMPNG